MSAFQSYLDTLKAITASGGPPVQISSGVPVALRLTLMTDPYLNHAHCVARLIREWEKHGRLIVALDFDDTLWPFHDNGATYPLVTQLARECSDLGWHIVIWTASSPDRYPLMRAHLEERGIKVAAINENPPELKLPFGKWGKIYFNVCLDDRAGLAAAYAALREVVDHVKAAKGA